MVPLFRSLMRKSSKSAPGLHGMKPTSYRCIRVKRRPARPPHLARGMDATHRAHARRLQPRKVRMTVTRSPGHRVSDDRWGADPSPDGQREVWDGRACRQDRDAQPRERADRPLLRDGSANRHAGGKHRETRRISAEEQYRLHPAPERAFTAAFGHSRRVGKDARSAASRSSGSASPAASRTSKTASISWGRLRPRRRNRITRARAGPSHARALTRSGHRGSG